MNKSKQYISATKNAIKSFQEINNIYENLKTAYRTNDHTLFETVVAFIKELQKKYSVEFTLAKIKYGNIYKDVSEEAKKITDLNFERQSLKIDKMIMLRNIARYKTELLLVICNFINIINDTVDAMIKNKKSDTPNNEELYFSNSP